ncbi:hypothetical protein D3C87_1868970 [compost metagenome]
MAAFLVNAGLDGNGHAGLQTDIKQLLVEAVGFLMDVGKVSHSVAGAALVIQSVVPHGFSRQHIQVGASGAIQELGCGQSDDGFQNQSEILLLFPGQLA